MLTRIPRSAFVTTDGISMKLLHPRAIRHRQTGLLTSFCLLLAFAGSQVANAQEFTAENLLKSSVEVPGPQHRDVATAIEEFKKGQFLEARAKLKAARQQDPRFAARWRTDGTDAVRRETTGVGKSRTGACCYRGPWRSGTVSVVWRNRVRAASPCRSPTVFRQGCRAYAEIHGQRLPEAKYDQTRPVGARWDCRGPAGLVDGSELSAAAGQTRA